MKTTHAQASKMMKAELKKAYPETKFSVRSESFAGGNAIRIEWTEGPQEKDVKQITDKYQYGSFNGMIDCYEYTNSRDDIPQVKYVSTNRKITAETTAKAIKRINKDFGLNISYVIAPSKWEKDTNYITIDDEYLPNMNCYTNQFVYRQMQEYGI